MALLEDMQRQGTFLFKYRGTLPLFILAVGLAVFILQEINISIFHFSIDFDYYIVVCLAVSLFGLLIRIFAIGFAPVNTSGRNVDAQIADTLNTTGLYSIVRHPLYLGNFIIWLGLALLTRNFWFISFFILLFWIYYERIMFAEEQFLKEKFGELFLNWARITPAFIPKLSLWHRAEITFSIKKVLKKEKNGLAAICIVFYLFDVVRNLVIGNNIFFQHLWLFILCVFGTFFYLLFSFLKRKTKLLDEEGR